MTLRAIYNLYLHPLAHYPGSRTWTVSRLPYVWQLARGRLAQRVKELHEIYGPVVRLGPNELSYIDGHAWHDIYGHHQGSKNFPKNPLWMAPAENGIHSILSANDADHSRYRRLLAHAFSERALIQQEDLLLSYVDLLVNRLRQQVSSPSTAVVDLVKWLNFTTFDVIGDLSLGESFKCLEDGRYHEWVSILFDSFKFAAIFISLRFYGLDVLVKKILPKRVLQKRTRHAEMANSRIHRRLAQGKIADAQKNDFVTYVLRHNDEKGMAVPEIEQTLRILVAVGSETTATALSGIVRCLLQNPDTLEKLNSEIRHAFRHRSEVNAISVKELTYLSAVIEEGLRLCPPVPLGMPRVVPTEGAEVSGQWLPGGVSSINLPKSSNSCIVELISHIQTFVSASGFAANRSTLNFPDNPHLFNPSRWLNESNPITPNTGNASSNSKSAFNPFSLGPRNCLGRNLAHLEMRLVLTYLLWTFDLELPKHQMSAGPGKWEDQNNWILWEKAPLMVKLTVRKGSDDNAS